MCGYLKCAYSTVSCVFGLTAIASNGCKLCAVDVIVARERTCVVRTSR